MRKFFIPLALCLFCFPSFSQFIYKIKADSLLVTNDSCTAELNLENSTKDSLGFLYNKGRGRTEFRRGLIRYNDSTYIIGADTLKLGSGSADAWKLNGNSGINANQFLGTTDFKDLRIRTNNITRAVFNVFGNVGIGTAAPTQKLHLYGLNPTLFIEGDGSSYYGGIVLKSLMGQSYINNYGVNSLSGTFIMKTTINNGAVGVGITLNGAASVSEDSTAITHRVVAARHQVADMFRISRNIHTVPGAVTEQPVFVVNKDGKVGIGMTNPAYSLDVVGSVNIKGTERIARADANWDTPILETFDNAGARLFQVRSSLRPGTVYQNIFIGDSAGNIAEGGENIGIGAKVLKWAYDWNNVGIGAGALENATGYGNVAIGSHAGSKIGLNHTNILIGDYAGSGLVGSNNYVIGQEGMGNPTGTPSYNIAIGKQALWATNNGGGNISIGTQSGLFVVGNHNIFLGTDAGRNLTGSKNIMIGWEVASAPLTASNRLYIDNSATSTPLIYGEFDNRLLKINGKLGIQAGTNASIGTATLSNGTITVTTSMVSPTSIIMVTYNTPSGTQGFLSAPAASIIAGTSFVINSSSGADNSTVNWWIIN